MGARSRTKKTYDRRFDVYCLHRILPFVEDVSARVTTPKPQSPANEKRAVPQSCSARKPCLLPPWAGQSEVSPMCGIPLPGLPVQMQRSISETQQRETPAQRGSRRNRTSAVQVPLQEFQSPRPFAVQVDRGTASVQELTSATVGTPET